MSSDLELTNDFTDYLKNFPLAKNGKKRYVITPEKQAKDETEYKIEIMPGISMEVDCNMHHIAGKWEEKMLEGWGYNYYELSSNGKVASTRMACLNGETKTEFVKAPSFLADYNSNVPIVVYIPQGMELMYKIWEAKEAYIPNGKSDFENPAKKEEQNRAYLSKLSKLIDENQKITTIYLKPQSELVENTTKIQIIPGKTSFVDCNKHILSGKMLAKTTADGISYYQFDSNGETYSTLMACPDNKPQEKFVTGAPQFVAYNHNVPIVVILHRNIDLQYRIWTTNDQAIGATVN